jgi:transposase
MADLLAALYASGLSQAKIASLLGVSRPTIIKWMETCGIETRDPRGGGHG